jgi:hypothetical protein
MRSNEGRRGDREEKGDREGKGDREEKGDRDREIVLCTLFFAVSLFSRNSGLITFQ